MTQPEYAKIEPYSARVAAALYRWHNLQSRKINPSGTFDKQGRWYPDDDEREECCDSIRSPSRAYPYSYMVHCRSYEHVARKYCVDIKDLRREAKCCAMSQKPTTENV